MEDLSLKKRVNWLCAVAWMILIFGFSSQNAELSAQASGGFVDFAAKCIRFVSGLFCSSPAEVDLGILTFLIRKGAHAFLFAVLGVLVCRSFTPEGKIPWRCFLLSLMVSFLYACSDEVHQLFEAGRSCEFRDVLIDTVGALCGAVLLILARRCRNRENGK